MKTPIRILSNNKYFPYKEYSQPINISHLNMLTKEYYQPIDICKINNLQTIFSYINTPTRI